MERMICRLTECKFDGGELKPMQFKGYGAVFGNIDSYGDVIEPGAFAQFLSDAQAGKQPWPAMLSQHGGYGMTADDMTPVGVWESLAEDGTGLVSVGTLAATPRGQELNTLMKMEPRPAIDGLSIGYITKEAIPRSKPEEPRRRIKRVDLIEISPVTFPANARARVASVKGADFSEREFERLLTQDAGFSRSEARTIITLGFKSLRAMQDAGSDELAAVVESLNRNTRNLLQTNP